LPADWPSPTPEAEIRTRVRLRTRTLRRRRLLPALAVLAALPLAVVARPEPGGPVRVAAEGEAPPSTEPPVAEKPTDTIASSTTTTTTTAPGTPPAASVVVPGPDGDKPLVQVTPPPVRRFPQSPQYATKHPVLVDAQGDATVQTAPARRDPDPFVDAVHLDVKADAAAVTTELRMLDLTGEPLEAHPHGRPSSLHYRVFLWQSDAYFSFGLELADGKVTTEGTYWTPNTDTDGGWYTAPGTHTYRLVENVTGSVDFHAGIVRITATFEELNRAMAGAHEDMQAADARRDYEPIGLGSVVVPTGETASSYTNVYENYHETNDQVKSDKPDFAYRLGD
jgi:hypothetical protein